MNQPTNDLRPYLQGREAYNRQKAERYTPFWRGESLKYFEPLVNTTMHELTTNHGGFPSGPSAPVTIKLSEDYGA